jgi:hypothetical protein
LQCNLFFGSCRFFRVSQSIWMDLYCIYKTSRSGPLLDQTLYRYL